MSIKYIITFISLLMSLKSQATTPEDCANRASQAYGSTTGTDYEKSSAGSKIASECFNEFSKSSSNYSESGYLGWIIISLIASALIYFSYVYLNDYMRNATLEEMKEFLAYDMITNKQNPVTEKILDLQKQKTDYFNKILKSAIAGESNFKWRDLRTLMDERFKVASEIENLGAREKALTSHRKRLKSL